MQLDFLPELHELEYYGDTRHPKDEFEQEFEQNRTRNINRTDLNKAAFAYLQPTTKLVKVIPLDDPRSQNPLNQNWPAGQGALQYKLKEGVRKSATIVEIINQYPHGIFKGI